MTTCRPSAASARASGCCMRRGISWPWSSTTQESPAPYSVYSRRSRPSSAVEEELADALGDQHGRTILLTGNDQAACRDRWSQCDGSATGGGPSCLRLGPWPPPTPGGAGRCRSPCSSVPTPPAWAPCCSRPTGPPVATFWPASAFTVSDARARTPSALVRTGACRLRRHRRSRTSPAGARSRSAWASAWRTPPRPSSPG